jgi:predicted aldo/keto reductase-like oxidoreductase
VLLKDNSSPFGKALTPVQCIAYALDRPGVASVLPGADTPEQVAACLGYFAASDEEKDYASVIGASRFYSLSGRCMYCNHCLPCPVEINIAEVGRFLDMAQAAQKEQGSIPDTVKAHYAQLTAHAEDCISCGGCEERCPFSVAVRERMALAVQTFGL